MELEIRKLRYDDLPEVEENLLDINKEELMAMRGVSVTEFFKSEIEIKMQTEVLVIDGEIVCLGGGMDTPEGFLVWLFGTNKLQKHKRYFTKIISDKFNEFKTMYSVLYSYVYSKNELTKGWLKMMGFTICDPEPIGKNGEYFHYFEWREECV
jgi:hypothetical protein